MKKVEAIINAFNLEEVKNALNGIGAICSLIWNPENLLPGTKQECQNLL